MVTELDQLGTSRRVSLPSASRRWCLKPSRGSRCRANPLLSRDAVLINSTKAHGFCLPGAPLSRYPHTPMGVQMAPPFPPASTLPSPPLHLREPAAAHHPCPTRQSPWWVSVLKLARDPGFWAAASAGPVDKCSLKRMRPSKDPNCFGRNAEKLNNLFKKSFLPSAVCHLHLVWPCTGQAWA